MVKKLVLVAALSQNSCSAHVDDKSGPGGLLPEEIPGILNIRLRQYRTKPRKNEEGVETGWRASPYTG